MLNAEDEEDKVPSSQEPVLVQDPQDRGPPQVQTQVQAALPLVEGPNPRAPCLLASAHEHFETLRRVVEGITLANVRSNRWCVDSGANRHLVIGEAGMGHSFKSEAEGPINVAIQGKPSKLLC